MSDYHPTEFHFGGLWKRMRELEGAAMTDLLDRLRSVDPALVVECGHEQMDCGISAYDGCVSDLSPEHLHLGCPGPQPNIEALVRVIEAAAEAHQQRGENCEECCIQARGYCWSHAALAAALTGEEES